MNEFYLKIQNPRQNNMCPNTSVQRHFHSGLVSLFNGISTLSRLFNAKSILREEQ